jgi:predicted double-glycine peptidase
MIGRIMAPMPSNFVLVPVVTQRKDFSCGAAATLAILRYWDPDGYANVDEATLYEPLQTTHARGTEPEPIVAYLRSAGLDATYRHTDVTVADLERAVDRHEPPIVDLQAWTDHPTPYRETWDAGHYVVMVGYDDERLYFADPSTMTPDGFGYLTRAELEERWHDLAGDHDERVERMAIFVRSPLRAAASTNPPAAEGSHVRSVMPASAVALG